MEALLLAARIVMMPCLALALTGCQCITKNSLSGRLWTSDDFSHHRMFNLHAPVALFHSPTRNDFLFAYTERRDDDKEPKPRAYFVHENNEAIANQRSPGFVSTNQPGLVPVLVNGDITLLPRAILGEQLSIHTTNETRGPYALP